VDAVKHQVLRDLIQQMREDPATIERAVCLVFLSRNFERTADHATNMAEDAIFMVEAKDVRHHHE
jgi:phosphate transport system protein